MCASHECLAVSGTTTCTPLPPVSIAKLARPRSTSRVADVLGCLLARRRNPAPSSGSRSNTMRSGASTSARLAAPAVELDRAHLHAGQHARRVVDVEVVLGAAVLLGDRHVMHVLAERAGIVLLEEALLGPPLRAAHQADRAPAAHGSINGRDRLRSSRPARPWSGRSRGRSPGRGWRSSTSFSALRRLLRFPRAPRPPPACRRAARVKLPWRTLPRRFVAPVNSENGHFGDQLGPQPGHRAGSPPGRLPAGAVLRSILANFAASSRKLSALNPVPTLPL